MNYVSRTHVLQKDIPMYASLMIIPCIYCVGYSNVYAKITYCAYENHKPLLCVLAVPVITMSMFVFNHV